VLRYSILVLAFVLAGCASGPIPPTISAGNSISINHGTARFADAVEGARNYCAARGLSVRHISTSGGAPAVSTFECVGR
jgi:hypothetical protein